MYMAYRAMLEPERHINAEGEWIAGVNPLQLRRVIGYENLEESKSADSEIIQHAGRGNRTNKTNKTPR